MALNPNMSDHYGVEDTLDERQWAKLAPMLGQPYYVNQSGDLLCTQSNTALATNIAPGRAACYGFGADFKAQTVSHPGSTSTTPRYDLVAMRYDWTPDEASGGGNAYPVVIQGGPDPAIPGGRQKTPGVTYDMPIALAKVVYDPVGKAAQIERYIDLRRFANPIFSRAIETVPPEDKIDGMQVTHGQVTSYWSSAKNQWVTPMTDIKTGAIKPLSAATVAKNPKSGWLLSQIIVLNPGFTYSLILTGQLEIAAFNRVQVWMQYSNSTAATSWTVLPPQYFQSPYTAQTSSLSTQFIKNRNEHTVINLLAQVPDTETAANSSFSTTQYNGFFQAMVVPL